MRKKVLILSLGLALAFLVFFIMYGSAASYRWTVNSRQTYSFNSRDTILLRIPGMSSMYKRIALKGDLHLRVLSVSDDMVRVALQFTPLKITINGYPDTIAADKYSKLFMADMNKQGEFIKFYFSNELALNDEKGLEEIMLKLQSVFGRGLGKSWNTEERDNHGVYRASYRALDSGRTISKKKEKYVQVVNQDDETVKSEIVEIRKYEYNSRLAEDVSWLGYCMSSEHLAFKTGSDVDCEISGMTEISFREFARAGDLHIWQDFSPASLVNEWNSRPKNQLSISQIHDLDNFKRKYGDLSPKEFLDRYLKKTDKFSSAMISELISYLQLYPGSSGEFAAYLLANPGMREMGRAMIVHALGRVGNREAQESLCTIMNGRRYRNDNRQQAAVMMGSLDKPEQSTVDRLWDAYTGREKDYESNIHTTAVLSLGQIALTLDGRGKDSQSNEIKSRLKSQLGKSTDVNTQVALIHAAANTRDTSFVDDIIPYLGNSTTEIQAAAAMSLANFPEKRVDDILVRTYDSVDKYTVKEASIKGLNQRVYSSDAGESLMKQVVNEDNEILRSLIYSYLVKESDDPDVRSFLEERAKNEPSRNVRRIISSAINNKHKE